MPTKNYILTQFQTIPGVGPKTAEDLWNLGLRSLDELKNRDPMELYTALCDLTGKQVDRCMLYVFRCAVYYVSNESHDPGQLKWWNWKD